jgi:hypothetical protein
MTRFEQAHLTQSEQSLESNASQHNFVKYRPRNDRRPVEAFLVKVRRLVLR